MNKPIYFSRRREVSQPRETSPSRIEVTTNIPAAEVRGEDTSPRVEITQEERKIDPSQGYICQECLDQSKNSDE